jgi:hypothetical protein
MIAEILLAGEVRKIMPSRRRLTGQGLSRI